MVEGDRREIGARWRSEKACKDSDGPLRFAPCTCHLLVARSCFFPRVETSPSPQHSAKKESPSRNRRTGEPEVEGVRASCLVGNCPYRARATPNNRRTTGARPLPSFPSTTTFSSHSSKSTASKSFQPWRPFPSTTRPMEYVSSQYAPSEPTFCLHPAGSAGLPSLSHPRPPT